MPDALFFRQQIISSLESLSLESLKFLFELIQFLRFRNKPPLEPKIVAEPASDVWQFLATETGTIQVPVDWAMNHDQLVIR